jgi:protein tyrosine/serine phosphatase
LQGVRIRGTAFHYEQIPMEAWRPEQEDVVRFLRIVTDPKRVPVLVHCQHGADRTGMKGPAAAPK